MTTEGLQKVLARTNQSRKWQRILLASACCFALLPGVLRAQGTTPSQPAGAAHAGVLPASDLASLLPPSVFFKDKLAPLQVRNSGAMRWTDGSLLWAAMVDTSGYASDVQEVYQFYFVTEQPVTVGGKPLPAGVYGAGVVNGRLNVLDIGGHMLLTAPTETDAAMQRPRPLQVVAEGTNAVKVYLGKRWVMVQLHP